MQQSSNYNPYKLSVRRNKDLIRQYNQVNLIRTHPAPPSARESKQPYITLGSPNENILQYPLNYEQRYEFQQKKEEGMCGCFSSSGQQAEIYISPSQVISRKQLIKDTQWFYCIDKN